MNCAKEPRRYSAPRRSLFASTTQDDDSDLGHMSPLSSTENTSDSESASDEKYFKSLKNHSSDDYDILGNIYKQGFELDCTPLEKEKSLVSDNTVIQDTPVKESPLLKLETPHDTFVQNTCLPKLVRKVQMDEEESSEHKQQKTDSTKAKIRTALFQENSISIPVKSFYTKTEDLPFKPKIFLTRDDVKPKKKKDEVYLCGRKKRFGQINTGVRHRIKKPKHKKPTRMQLLKTAINLLENSSLNEYLNELKELQNKESTMIKPIKNKSEIKKNEEENNSKKFEISIKGHDICFIKKDENKIKTKEIENFFENTDEIKQEDVSNLINMLEDDKENTDFQAPAAKRRKLELLSPISQMCDTTSGLALNSPKKARNLTTVFENLATTQTSSTTKTEMEKSKFYPIFDLKTTKNKQIKKEKSTKNVNVKKWKALPPDQMLLDAGQKKFGPTQCPECEIVYHMGDPSEEIMHLNYHNAGNVLKFNGWKNEEVLVDFLDCRVIRVKPHDSKIWWQKVSALLEIVNRELGCYEVQLNMEHSHVYLYIKGKVIAGCLVAEQRSVAHRKLEMDGLDLCTEETYPVRCGVSRIWVSHNYRRSGIGTILMDCLKANFVFGYVLTNDDIAFSSPTEMGNNFAKKYFKTSNYLIYM